MILDSGLLSLGIPCRTVNVTPVRDNINL